MSFRPAGVIDSQRELVRYILLAEMRPSQMAF